MMLVCLSRNVNETQQQALDEEITQFLCNESDADNVDDSDYVPDDDVASEAQNGIEIEVNDGEGNIDTEELYNDTVEAALYGRRKVNCETKTRR